MWHSVGAATTATITGLTNENEYEFRVRASNGDGTSEPSAKLRATPTGVPAAPKGLQLFAGNTTASLFWNHPSDTSITRYEYRWKTTGEFSGWIAVQGSGRDTVHLAVSDLYNDAEHTFELRAVNVRGDGKTATGKVTPTAGPPRPPAPATFTAKGRTAQVRLDWTGTWDAAKFDEWQLRVRQQGQPRDLVAGAGSAQVRLHWVNAGTPVETAWEYRRGEVNQTTGDVTWDAAWTSITCESPCDPRTLDSHEVSATLTTGKLYAYAVRGTVGGSKVAAAGLEAWTAVSTTATDRGHTQSGLVNGTTYQFWLRAAYDAGGPGLPSSATAAPAPRPAKPANLAAEAQVGKVRLTWDRDTVSVIDKWQYRYKTDGAYGDWKDMSLSAVCANCHITGELHFTVTGLTNGAAHTFQVRGHHGDRLGTDQGTASDEVTATPREMPLAVSNLGAAPGNAKVDLTWDKPSAGTDVTKWRVRYITTGGNWGGWTEFAPAPSGNTMSHTITGLTNGRQYQVELQAGNAVTWGETATVQFVLPVAAPTPLWLVAGNTTASLVWIPVRNSSITGYEYRYKTTGQFGAWTAVPGSGRDTGNHTVTGLANDAEHTFELRAVHPLGPGRAATGKVTPTATPARPPAPATFTAKGLTEQVRLDWTGTWDTDKFEEWQLRVRQQAGTRDLVAGSGDAQVRLYWFNAATPVESAWEYRRGEVDKTTGVVTWGAWTSIDCSSPCAPNALDAHELSETLTAGTLYTYEVQGTVGVSKVAAALETWIDVGDSADTKDHTQIGLVNGTTYQFWLRAEYDTGLGLHSSAAATPAAAPAKPTNLKATARVGAVRLTWDNDTDDSIDKWQYHYKTDGAYGDWEDMALTAVCQNCAVTGKLGFTVTGLTNAVEHTFQVRAYNSDRVDTDQGTVSDPAKATPREIPLAVSNFTAAAGNARADLSWDKPSATAGVTRWEIRYIKAGDTDWVGWTVFTPTESGNTMSRALTGLTNGAQYHVEVRAGNAVTWGAAASAIVRPFLPPAAPTLTATAGRGQAALSWTLTDSRISSWQYRQKLSTDSTWGAWTLISRTPSDRSYTVTNLTDGLTYDFQVRARMARGAGVASATVSVKPLPAQAPAKAAGLTVSPGNAQVALDWKAERDGTITKWRLRVSPASAADVVIGTGSSQEITLSWTDPGNSAITAYQYSTDGSNWTNIAGSTATTTSHTFTATLTSGTAHTYQVEGVVAGQTNVTPTGLQAWSAFTDAGTLVTGPAVAPINALNFTSDNWNTVQTINVKLASQPSETVTVYMEELARVGSSPALYSPDTLTFTTDNWNTPRAVQVRLKHLVTSGRSAAVSFAGHALGATPMRHGHTASGLTNGTAYTFRVLPVNARGDGAASDSVTATPVNSPAAPTGFTAAGSTSGSAQVVLAWTDPGDDSITSWEYRRKSGITGEYGAWTAVPSSDKDTTTYTVTGLTHNALYRFQIRAVNATGNGNPSAALWARPVSAAPAAPTGLKATSGNARVQLTWSAKTNIHIDEFEYRHSTDGGTTWSAWTDVPGGGAARQVTVTGLDNGKVHTFKVRAVNTAGNAESGTASAPTRPLAPSSFSATGGDATVTLTWTKSASDATTLLRWEYRRKVGTGHYGGWTPIPGATGSTTSHTFTSMDNGTAYTYKLRAVNAAGAGAESAERVANPALAVPAKPTGFQAHAGPRLRHAPVGRPGQREHQQVAVPAGTAGRGRTSAPPAATRPARRRPRTRSRA